MMYMFLIRIYVFLIRIYTFLIGVFMSLIRIYMLLIRIYMFLIRIYMFDTVQEKGLAYRREDLKFLPTLNCTRWVFFFFFHTIGRLDEPVENHRDVLEDIVDLSAVDYTRRHTTPSPGVNICSCKGRESK